MITREKQIGHPLYKECKKALTTTNEYGASDNRIFCHGLYEEQSVTEIREECINCKAFVHNAEPPMNRVRSQRNGEQ